MCIDPTTVNLFYQNPQQRFLRWHCQRRNQWPPNEALMCNRSVAALEGASLPTLDCICLFSDAAAFAMAGECDAREMRNWGTPPTPTTATRGNPHGQAAPGARNASTRTSMKHQTQICTLSDLVLRPFWSCLRAPLNRVLFMVSSATLSWMCFQRFCEVRVSRGFAKRVCADVLESEPLYMEISL